MNKKELKKAYREGLISKEDYGKRLVKLEEKPKLKKETRIYESVSSEDFVKLLKATNKPQHKICFILGYGSGLRVSEITKLKRESFNFKTNQMFIRQAKGGKDRVTFLAKQFKKDYLKYIPIKIGVRAISKAFLSASLRAGFNSVIYTDKKGSPRYRFHFHSLRHSFSTRCLEKGLSIHHLQGFLGHSNISTTSRYLKSNPKDAVEKAMEVL